MSIVFLFYENPDVASAGSVGAAVVAARSVPDHAARSNSERAAPSARVATGFRLLRLSGINRTAAQGSVAKGKTRGKPTRRAHLNHTTRGFSILVASRSTRS